jgi:hypothetical protein
LALSSPIRKSNGIEKPVVPAGVCARVAYPGPAGRDGLKLPDSLADNHVEMNATDQNRQPAPSRRMSSDGVSLAFAAFALEHSGCGEETSELRLDERSLVGWCRRCNDSRIFVVD